MNKIIARCKSAIKGQGGYSLLEVMIGVVVISIISGFVIEFFVFTVDQTTNAQLKGSLEEELRRGVDTINNDIKSASAVLVGNTHLNAGLNVTSLNQYVSNAQAMVLRIQAQDSSGTLITPATEYNEVIYYVSGSELRRLTLTPLIPLPGNAAVSKSAVVLKYVDTSTSNNIFTYSPAPDTTKHVQVDITQTRKFIKPNGDIAKSISVRQKGEARLRNF